MSVWLHRRANREAARLYKTDAAKCLKNTHRTHFMGQLVEMLENTPGERRKHNFCTCGMCRSPSAKGCTHPHRRGDLRVCVDQVTCVRGDSLGALTEPWV
jgi:hypothetical protein